MKHLPIVCKHLPVTAIALYPFLIFQNQRAMQQETILRHEFIHFRQQLELLILPFYIFYLLNYLINLVIYRNHDQAYRNILFEREAYRYDADPNYLEQRSWFAWVNQVN